ncbi:MAG: hypothetical protein MUO63_01080 [Desulfobulbaceae bacterium]|nr:hypothetical protein [Desulfobulbaceae bacterium]
MAKPKKQKRTREVAGIEHAGRPAMLMTLPPWLPSSSPGEAGFITGQNFVIDGGMNRITDNDL